MDDLVSLLYLGVRREESKENCSIFFPLSFISLNTWFICGEKILCVKKKSERMMGWVKTRVSVYAVIIEDEERVEGEKL